jgi:F-type H+-transporting ATPase subunit b
MHLFTQTLNIVTGLVAEEGSFGLNLDIFESNIINLVILGGGIFKLGSTALSESLTERQQKIVVAIQESEERLGQAIVKLAESEKQLTQAQLVIASLEEDAMIAAVQAQSVIFAKGVTEVMRITLAAKNQIITSESRIRKEISDYVVSSTISNTVKNFKVDGMIPVELHRLIVNMNIDQMNNLKR